MISYAITGFLAGFTGFLLASLASAARDPRGRGFNPGPSPALAREMAAARADREREERAITQTALVDEDLVQANQATGRVYYDCWQRDGYAWERVDRYGGRN